MEVLLAQNRQKVGFEVVKCDKQVFVQGESSARHNGLPFSLQYRTTRVALVKATKNKANQETDKVRVQSASE